MDQRFENTLIEVLSQGLPLVDRPYGDIARQIGSTEERVLKAVKKIMLRGDIKRFGIVVRHRQLGYQANGMVVWDIPDLCVGELGQCIGNYPFVTLCYRRPRRLPDWRYNMFSMIHGRDRTAVIDQVGLIVQQCGLQDIAHEILFSKRCFKQRGACYTRHDSNSEDLIHRKVVNE